MIENSRMLKSSLPKTVQDSINRFQAVEKRFMELDDSKRDKFLTMMNVKDWEELEDKVMETSDTRFTNVLCEDMEYIIYKLEKGKDIKSSHKPIKSAHNFTVGDRVYVNQYREGKGHLWDSFGTVVDILDNDTYKIKWDSGKTETLKKGSFYSVEELPEPLKSAYAKKLIKSDTTDKMGNDKYKAIDSIILEYSSWSGDDMKPTCKDCAKELQDAGFGRSDVQEYFAKDGIYNEETGKGTWDKEFADCIINEFPIKSSRKITSARFTVTDKETGEVLGSADTYEEAVNQWGEEVLITDTQVTEEITSSKRLNMNKKETDYQFNKRIVNSVMLKDMTEEQAISQIASRNNINTGFAKRIFNNIMKDERYITSGIMDIADEINKQFDLNGDLDSWFEDYVQGSGKSNTVGGELVRAASRIIYRYENDGDMIGKGYGKETVNPAARYIIDKASDYSDVYEIKQMLDVDSDINRDEEMYSRWLDSFANTFADYLRDHEQLFHTPNKEDMWDWKTNDDYNTSVNEVYVDDGEGNKYYFSKEGDVWKCDSIDFSVEPDWYENDVVDDSDETFAQEIYDKSDEYGDVELDGFNYSWEAFNEPDDEGNYHEWLITDVKLLSPIADVDDYWYTHEFADYDVFDTSGNEVRETDML